MIVEIDADTKVIVKFRHRYFMRLNSPYSMWNKGSEPDPNWVELSGKANYCKAIAAAADNLSAFMHKVNGTKPLHITRGTVCTMKFLNRSDGTKLDQCPKATDSAPWVVYTCTTSHYSKSTASSALVVCAWDSTKNRHEPFIKWKGRRESLAKAILALPKAALAGCCKVGLLDMVCPDRPAKIKQRGHEPHAEVSGDMRTAHSV